MQKMMSPKVVFGSRDRDVLGEISHLRMVSGPETYRVGISH